MGPSNFSFIAFYYNAQAVLHSMTIKQQISGKKDFYKDIYKQNEELLINMEN